MNRMQKIAASLFVLAGVLALVNCANSNFQNTQQSVQLISPQEAAQAKCEMLGYEVTQDGFYDQYGRSIGKVTIKVVNTQFDNNDNLRCVSEVVLNNRVVADVIYDYNYISEDLQSKLRLR